MGRVRRGTVDLDTPEQMPKQTEVRDLVAFLARRRMMDTLWAMGPGGEGPIRFNAILAGSDVPRNTLAKRLRDLVDAGFVERWEADGPPPRVTYELTPKFLDLVPALQAMHAWGDKHRLEQDEEEEERGLRD